MRIGVGRAYGYAAKAKHWLQHYGYWLMVGIRREYGTVDEEYVKMSGYIIVYHTLHTSCC